MDEKIEQEAERERLDLAVWTKYTELPIQNEHSTMHQTFTHDEVKRLLRIHIDSAQEEIDTARNAALSEAIEKLIYHANFGVLEISCENLREILEGLKIKV